MKSLSCGDHYFDDLIFENDSVTRTVTRLKCELINYAEFRILLKKIARLKNDAFSIALYFWLTFRNTSLQCQIISTFPDGISASTFYITHSAKYFQLQ